MLSQDSYMAVILTQASEGAGSGAGSQPHSAPAGHAIDNSDKPDDATPQSGKMPSLESADFAMAPPSELFPIGDGVSGKGSAWANRQGRATSTPLEGRLQPDQHAGSALVPMSANKDQNERRMAGKRKADALDEVGFVQCPAVLCQVLAPLKHLSMHTDSCKLLIEEQRFKNNPHSPGQKRRVECGLCHTMVQIDDFVAHDCNPVETLQGKRVYHVRCD